MDRDPSPRGQSFVREESSEREQRHGHGITVGRPNTESRNRNSLSQAHRRAQSARFELPNGPNLRD